MTESVQQRLLSRVVLAGICTGCGACVALDPARRARMAPSPAGPVPAFDPAGAGLPELAWDACPGKGIRYPELYRRHYGRLPENWLLGCFRAARTGHSADADLRRGGASGGVLTHVLTRLLERGVVDGAVVARQGVPAPEQARAVIASSPADLRAAAQSVYVPVPMLDALAELPPGGRYAMTCLPDQSAALRVLQHAGFAPARQVRYVLGPYTGTALEPAAIGCYLRSCGVAADDAVESLKWRAGEWPGYLEIRTRSGRVLRSAKFYYNFLIPFFVTQSSLQGMDFANEFADISVGDAWSPRFEGRGGGHSVILTRSEEMERLVAEMAAEGSLAAEPLSAQEAMDMHGHMLDFKKRGGYIRNRVRRAAGLRAPDFGMRPSPLPASRVLVELVILCVFAVCGTRLARGAVARVPERIIGPLFNRLRLAWKSASKPTKRRGLRNLRMVEELRACPLPHRQSPDGDRPLNVEN